MYFFNTVANLSSCTLKLQDGSHLHLMYELALMDIVLMNVADRSVNDNALLYLRMPALQKFPNEKPAELKHVMIDLSAFPDKKPQWIYKLCKRLVSLGFHPSFMMTAG